MKLSISLPDKTAQEIKMLATRTDKSVSWWVARAWDASRSRLFQQEQKATVSHRRFLRTLDSLRGSLKADFPDTDSVSLAHQAFSRRK